MSSHAKLIASLGRRTLGNEDLIERPVTEAGGEASGAGGRLVIAPVVSLGAHVFALCGSDDIVVVTPAFEGSSMCVASPGSLASGSSCLATGLLLFASFNLVTLSASSSARGDPHLEVGNDTRNRSNWGGAMRGEKENGSCMSSQAGLVGGETTGAVSR